MSIYPKVINLLKNFYDNGVSHKILNGRICPPCKEAMGVRQGKTFENKIFENNIVAHVFIYEDDVCIMANNEQSLDTCLKLFDEICSSGGLL